MEKLIDKYNVAQNMKKARLGAGLTQLQVAEALGTTRQTIINWEKDPETLTFEKYSRLAELYGVTMSYFFGL